VDFNPRPHRFYIVDGGHDFTFQTNFIAKYAPSGDLFWVVTAPCNGASNEIDVKAVAVDAADNIHLCGTLLGSFDANPSPRRVYRARSSYRATDLLLWTLTPEGGLSYVTTQTLPNVSDPQDPNNFGFVHFAMDSSGYSCVAGDYTRWISGGSGAILSKFSPMGKLLWTHPISEFNDASVALGPGGAPALAYVALTSTAERDIHLARFSAKGRFISDVPVAAVSDVRPPTGEYPFPPSLASLSLDQDGSAVICGTFSTAGDFDGGAGELLLHGVDPQGHAETVYLAKYDQAGRPIFAHAIGSGGGDVMAAGAAIDGEGSIHLSGSFSGSVLFDDGAPANFDTRARADADMFFARYDSAGRFLGADSLPKRPGYDFACACGFGAVGSMLKGVALSISCFDPATAPFTVYSV
jgi:hypothetical protein